MFRAATRIAIVAGLLAALPVARARADGGTLRVLERRGSHEVAVFTAPAVPRAGPVDVSVLVQDAATRQPEPDARVSITLAPRDRAGAALTQAASAANATNKLFQSAILDIPSAGVWDITAHVDSPRGPADVRFPLEVAPPPPPWLTLWPLLTWPAIVILLFAVHQRLVWRRQKAARTAFSP